MKSIMISIKPELVEKILNGEKTIEIRKTMPKCELPIKVYIYCNKINDSFIKNCKEIVEKYYHSRYLCSKSNKIYSNREKILAEFTLNIVEQYGYCHSPSQFVSNYYKVVNNEITSIKLEYKNTCLTKEELIDYAYDGEILPKPVYAWHIEDLKIYGEPKELNEFYKPLSDNDLENGNYDINCGGEVSCMDYPEGGDFCATCKYGGAKPFKKAPSGFCYVEEV